MVNAPKPPEACPETSAAASPRSQWLHCGLRPVPSSSVACAGCTHTFPQVIPPLTMCAAQQRQCHPNPSGFNPGRAAGVDLPCHRHIACGGPSMPEAGSPQVPGSRHPAFGRIALRAAGGWMVVRVGSPVLVVSASRGRCMASFQCGFTTRRVRPPPPVKRHANRAAHQTVNRNGPGLRPGSTPDRTPHRQT